VNDIEVKINKYLPTWDLITILQEKYPDYYFIFCMGTDLVESLRKWDNGDRLVNEVEFIIITRPEYNPDETCYPKNCQKLKIEIEGSSTKIRNRIREQIENKNKINLGITGLTTTSVIKYIIKEGLYQTITN
jgi:nicotinic acid mononucleotide adenylyltransferase